MKATGIQHSQANKGFSLIELLLVISAIAVFAAIIIPNLGYITATANDASSKRNAQDIVSVFLAGQAAGISWNNSNRNSCVTDVISGKRGPTGGSFSGQVFRVPGITGGDLSNARRFIGFDNGSSNIYFDNTGSQPSS